jgi:hypothetical protein
MALKILGLLAIPVISWFGAPIVKSWLEGTPLNGIRKLLGRPAVPGTKTALSIIVLTAPQPKWHIGAMAREPMLHLSMHANLAHKSDVSLIIVQAYLKGTKPCGPFFPITVAGPYDGPSMIHFMVRPIIVTGLDKLTRRAVLVDQFGAKHVTEPVTFSTVPIEPWRRGMRDESQTIKCFICDEQISMIELHETAAFPAHRRCIK